MPPIALSPASFANAQSSSMLNSQSSSFLNPQSTSTSNRRFPLMTLTPLWSFPPLFWGLPVLALGILVLTLCHRVTSRSPVHHPLKRRQKNPSANIHLPLAPNTAKPLEFIPALPPPFPMPTIRRHSYPLTINSNINSNAVLSPSSSPSSSPPLSAIDSSGAAKRCSGSRRHTSFIRQNTKEDVNGCRRHVMVFQKPG